MATFSVVHEFFVSLAPAVALTITALVHFFSLNLERDRVQNLANEGYSRVVDINNHRVKSVLTSRVGVSDIVMLFEGEFVPADGVALLCGNDGKF